LVTSKVLMSQFLWNTYPTFLYSFFAIGLVRAEEKAKSTAIAIIATDRMLG